MNWFNDLPTIYLHRLPVDFRKAVNGLSEIVEQELLMNPFDECLYVFCNRNRDRLKILHWDKTGFVLWYKRLEKEKFKWLCGESGEVIQVDEHALHCLLSGLPVLPLKPHKTLYYQALS